MKIMAAAIGIRNRRSEKLPAFIICKVKDKICHIYPYKAGYSSRSNIQEGMNTQIHP